MYVNCQGALAIKIWPGIFILKNCEVHQNQKNGTKQPNGYILSAYEKISTNGRVKSSEGAFSMTAAVWIYHQRLFEDISFSMYS